MSLDHVVRREEVLWLLGSLCGLFRIPFDAALITQHYPPPYTLATFHEAARALGLKTGTRPVGGVDWPNLPFRSSPSKPPPRLRPLRPKIRRRPPHVSSSKPPPTSS